MKVLFAASEIYPYAKTGGLADVANALPLALKEYVNIARIMPLYGFMQADSFAYYDSFTITLGTEDYSVSILQDESEGIVTYFVQAPFLSQKDSLYGEAYGEYADNALRFAIFSMAIVQFCLRQSITLIHLNDWHTALVALFIKDFALPVKTLFTIHNLAYQGIFKRSSLSHLGIKESYFTLDGIEFYGKINFLKAGIAYSDTITTVSTQYAKEILLQTYGCGLEGFLQVHQKRLFGIMNGIDTHFFNPLTDNALAYNYDIKNITKKEKNKQFLVQKFQIKNLEAPLFIMISRLVEQKGITLLRAILEEFLCEEVTLLIVGEGERPICQELLQLAQTHDNLHLFCGYDETLSHQAYAGADFLLMPSVFEPCGLNQMIAMRYGVIPIVHAVGGLKESVHENEPLCGRGICYEEQTIEAFLAAIKRALILQNKVQEEIRLFNMQCDFSFNKSALAYLKLYECLSS